MIKLYFSFVSESFKGILHVRYKNKTAPVFLKNHSGKKYRKKLQMCLF